MLIRHEGFSLATEPPEPRGWIWHCAITRDATLDVVGLGAADTELGAVRSAIRNWNYGHWGREQALLAKATYEATTGLPASAPDDPSPNQQAY